MSSLLRAEQLLRSLAAAAERMATGLRLRTNRNRPPERVTAGREAPIEIMAEAPCCFVLSTGRCGTMFLAEMLRHSSALWVVHQPRTTLGYVGRMAYERVDVPDETWRWVVTAARYEDVRTAYTRGLKYVETNNRLTFVAPHLAAVFGRSRFIHLVRHPGAFVRSGVRRKYYEGIRTDEARIGPRSGDPFAQAWERYTQVEKVGWLWNATNRYIENFKNTMDSDRVLTIKSEDLFGDVDTCKRIFRFVGVTAPGDGRIRKKLKGAVNVQRSGSFPGYDDWPAVDKSRLRAVAPLAGRYGYEL